MDILLRKSSSSSAAVGAAALLAGQPVSHITTELSSGVRCCLESVVCEQIEKVKPAECLVADFTILASITADKQQDQKCRRWIKLQQQAGI